MERQGLSGAPFMDMCAKKETQITSPPLAVFWKICNFILHIRCCPKSLALSYNRIYRKRKMVLYKSVFALVGKLVRSRPSSLAIPRFCLSTCSERKIENLKTSSKVGGNQNSGKRSQRVPFYSVPLSYIAPNFPSTKIVQGHHSQS